jgi:hypothetical protein
MIQGRRAETRLPLAITFRAFGASGTKPSRSDYIDAQQTKT